MIIGNRFTCQICNIELGIALGSVLDPPLFISYAGDIMKTFNEIEAHLLADDTNILHDKSESRVNEMLDENPAWLLERSLFPNSKKTQLVRFGSKNLPSS